MMEAAFPVAAMEPPARGVPWSARCRVVVVPTLDYEIFHGRTALTPEETLFAPTQRLLAGAERRGIPFTLFADVCSVWRHRDFGSNAFARRFERQLIEARSRGHDVQLHVHAHWARAQLHGSEWRLMEPKVTLADLDYGSGEPASIVERGVKYLNELLRPVDQSYRCIGFRAGGLCLQPGERQLIEILERAGVLIDSSIAKDYVLDTDMFGIDYRGMPDRTNWKISSREGLRESSDGVFEIPVLTFSPPVADRAAFLARRLLALRTRRGSPMSRTTRQSRLFAALTLLRQNLRYLVGRPVLLFSADTKGFTRRMLLDAFAAFFERQIQREERTAFISMLNHPKLMLPEQESLLFDVLEELKSRFGELVAFATLSDVARSEAVHG